MSEEREYHTDGDILWWLRQVVLEVMEESIEKKKKKKRERNLVNEEKGKEDKCLGEIRILNKYRVL